MDPNSGFRESGGDGNIVQVFAESWERQIAPAVSSVAFVEARKRSGPRDVRVKASESIGEGREDQVLPWS
jgi:hypothetical protein